MWNEYVQEKSSEKKEHYEKCSQKEISKSKTPNEKDLLMAKGVKHYTRDGKVWNRGMHKMANGKLHTGKSHTANSKPLFHFGQLSDKAKKMARSQRGK